MNYEPGCPARSLSGHDKGQYYVILACEGEYVLVSDGRRRPAARPKRKNKKHIQADHSPLSIGAPPTDERIQRELRDYIKRHK
ncbi:MAG: hypothetical protein Q4C73_03285 [Eubacteriales bacterium]|nr:hypothetical protein [Eubacteriales bacterium]